MSPEWTVSVRVGVLQLAGLASIGAGAIHAAAVGLHSEHTTLARLFVVVAVAQLGVGLLTLVSGGRLAAAGTVAVNLAAVAAWGATRLWDIGWIDGLEQAESPAFADAACAVLGAIAAAAAALAIFRRRTAVSTAGLGLPAFSVGIVVLAAMLTGANDSHAHGDAVVASGAAAPVAADDHGDEHGAADGVPAAAAVPYDPARPIDLSGTPGVTQEQQAFAENLVSSTLRDLPQWADTATAAEAGFRSIGDAASGFEHFVQWHWIDDDVWLDPDYPESLVYRVEADGSRTLASAMYMLPNSMPLEEVPDWGGALMQWHVHSDLCFDVSDLEAPRVGGLTDAAGECTAPLVRLGEAPMIHIWIVPHECGPFAALEGVGAGQVAAGETHRCDHAHGSLG